MGRSQGRKKDKRQERAQAAKSAPSAIVSAEQTALAQAREEQKRRLAELLAPRPIKRVALMGISAHPPHVGHMAAARELAKHYDLVIVSPADGNPFKPNLPALAERLEHTESLAREALAGNAKVKVRSIGGLVAAAKRQAGAAMSMAYTIEELEWLRREGELLGEIWEIKAAFGPDVLQAGSFERFKEAGRILAEFGVDRMPDNGCPRSSQLRAAMGRVEKWGAEEFLALAGRVGRANALEFIASGRFLKPGCEIDAEAIGEAMGRSRLNEDPALDPALFGEEAKPQAGEGGMVSSDKAGAATPETAPREASDGPRWSRLGAAGALGGLTAQGADSVEREVRQTEKRNAQKR
jgi:nicotinic acid mononucleotide adenylyltransferase